MLEWSFDQDVVCIDKSKKKIVFDVSKNKQHVCNKSGEFNNNKRSNMMKKFWHALLDSQSTCGGILNLKLASNIRQ